MRPGRRCAGRGWGRAGTSSLYQPWTCSSCDRSWGAQLTASPARAANGSSKKTRGGGAIECRVLAGHYGAEICCVDCQTMNVYRFGERAARLSPAR